MRGWLIGFGFFMFSVWSSQSLAGGGPWESFSSGYWLRLSGQLNKAYIYIEDGNRHEPHTIDNFTSPSVLRLESGRTFSESMQVGSALEADVTTHPSNQLIIEGPILGDGAISIRDAEVFAEGVRWGRLSMGRGETASYYTSVVDLSGTNFVINADIPLLLGGVSLQDDKEFAFSPTIRELFGDFDGLRLLDRIRYDAPAWRGLTPSASVVSRDTYDIALRYAREISKIKVAAATSYAQQTSASIRTRKAVVSGSALLPSGISLTFAGGYSNPSNRSSGVLLYGKLGFSFNLCTDFVRSEGRCLVKIFDGKTSMAIDVNKVNNFNQKGDRATAYGFAMVQAIPSLATELYVGWRLHELKPSNYPPAKDFRWLWGVMGGARVKL